VPLHQLTVRPTGAGPKHVQVILDLKGITETNLGVLRQCIDAVRMHFGRVVWRSKRRELVLSVGRKGRSEVAIVRQFMQALLEHLSRATFAVPVGTVVTNTDQPRHGRGKSRKTRLHQPHRKLPALC
jgi:hypothetical protein